MKKLRYKQISIITLCVICCWLIGILSIDLTVTNNAKGKLISIDELNQYDIQAEDSVVGILLGTTPQSRYDRVKNPFFIPRIEAAAQLYQSGAISYILVSGDESSLDGVNETECMIDSLTMRGVPVSKIKSDGTGFRTINSVENAVKKFGIRRMIFISQQFHNERAIYLAEHLGINVENVRGFNAKMPNMKQSWRTRAREYFARVKMFIDIACYKDRDLLNKYIMDEPLIYNTTDTLHQNGLIIYRPSGHVELVCGNMPSPDDNSIMMCCEAAFTGQLLDEFSHTNIAGDHVSNGVYHKGYSCKENTGCFTYEFNCGIIRWRFVMDDCQSALEQVAHGTGCGFSQVMLIHYYKRQPKDAQKLTSRNYYRVLAEYNRNLCIIDSKGVMNYNNFVNALLDIGVKHALYLDMGTGWNYSFYRDNRNIVRFIHNKRIKNTTNWIVFQNKEINSQKSEMDYASYLNI